MGLEGVELVGGAHGAVDAHLVARLVDGLQAHRLEHSVQDLRQAQPWLPAHGEPGNLLPGKVKVEEIGAAAVAGDEHGGGLLLRLMLLVLRVVRGVVRSLESPVGGGGGRPRRRRRVGLLVVVWAAGPRLGLDRRRTTC